MIVAIISDVHDNIPNLKKVLDYCAQNKVEKMICCGDLATLETLNFLNDYFAGEISLVFGNMDNDYLKNYPFPCHPERNEGTQNPSVTPPNNVKYKKTHIYKEFGEAEISGKKIAFVHFPENARALCGTKRYDFVFHGHTHMPWEETVGNCKIINPGNVANQRCAPTFAVWNVEQNKFDLIRINELK